MGTNKSKSKYLKHTPTNEKKAAELFKKRIAKGIKYLDGQMKRKDWLEKLNPISINLSENDTCVVGQIFGSYFEEFGSFASGKEEVDGAQYGFFIEDGFIGGKGHEQWLWDLLSYMWAKKLVELKHKNGFKS